MTDERTRTEALEEPSQLPRPTPAPEKNHRDEPAGVENPHHSEARRESPDNPKKGANWQFIGVVVAIIGVVVAIIFGSLALRISRENTEALRKIAEITAELVAENPTEAAETAKSVQGNLVASLIDKAIASAVQLQRQGKTEAAIEKWRSIANVAGEEDRPLQARAWASIGYLLDKGEGADWEAVLDAYTKAIELNPDYAAAYNNRGIAKSHLGQDEAALADYDRAIELNPALAVAYNNRGNANVALDRRPAAREDFETALALAQEAGNENVVASAKRNLRLLDNIEASGPQGQ